MKTCTCSDFKQLITGEGRLLAVQDWNFCMFCGKKMMVAEKILDWEWIYDILQSRGGSLYLEKDSYVSTAKVIARTMKEIGYEKKEKKV